MPGRAYLRIAAIIYTLLWVAGCQSVPSADNLDNGLEAATTQKPVEKLGSGPVKVAMILNFSADSANGGMSKSYRDGAALAMDDLGNEQLTLYIYDVANNQKSIKGAVDKAVAENSKLLIVPNNNTVLKTAAVPENKSSIVVLGDKLSPKYPRSYAFLPDGISSLIAGIEHVAKPDRKKLVLILSEDQIPADVDRISKAVSRSADLHAALVYKPNQNIKKLVQDNQQKLNSADIIAFATNSPDTLKIVKEVTAQTGQGRKQRLVGRNDWSQAIKSDPSVSGILVATLNQEGLGMVSSRFQEKYSKPINAQAGFTYDLIAMGSGLTRIKGNDGISKSNLENSSGFKGTLGNFRFKSDGSVERGFQLSRYRNGRVEQVQPAPKGF